MGPREKKHRRGRGVLPDTKIWCFNYSQQSVLCCVCVRDRSFLVCTTVASPASVSQGFCRCPFSAPSLVAGAYSWGSPVPLPVVLIQLTMCLTSIVYAVCRLVCRHNCCCFAQPPAVGWSWLNLSLFALRARLNVFVRLGLDSESSSLVADSSLCRRSVVFAAAQMQTL